MPTTERVAPALTALEAFARTVPDGRRSPVAAWFAERPDLLAIAAARGGISVRTTWLWLSRDHGFKWSAQALGHFLDGAKE